MLCFAVPGMREILEKRAWKIVPWLQLLSIWLSLCMTSKQLGNSLGGMLFFSPSTCMLWNPRLPATQGSFLWMSCHVFVSHKKASQLNDATEAVCLMNLFSWILCRVLGCPEGRSAKTWVDFNLFGHQVSLLIPSLFFMKIEFGAHLWQLSMAETVVERWVDGSGSFCLVTSECICEAGGVSWGAQLQCCYHCQCCW